MSGSPGVRFARTAPPKSAVTFKASPVSTTATAASSRRLLSSLTTGSAGLKRNEQDEEGMANTRTIFFARPAAEDTQGVRAKEVLGRLQRARSTRQLERNSSSLYAQDLLVAAITWPRLSTWVLANSGLWRFLGRPDHVATREPARNLERVWPL